MLIPFIILALSICIFNTLGLMLYSIYQDEFRMNIPEDIFMLVRNPLIVTIICQICISIGCLIMIFK